MPLVKTALTTTTKKSSVPINEEVVGLNKLHTKCFCYNTQTTFLK